MTAPASPRLPLPGLTDLLARQREALAAQQKVLVDAMKATHSESDKAVYALDLYLVAHPEACHTAKDYPDWTPGGTA